jgi:hypothetical protein
MTEGVVDDDELFSRQEVLGGGLSRVRRARALLYLIEQEAARISDKRATITATATLPIEAGLSFNALAFGDAETMREALPGEQDEAFIQSFRNARRGAPSAHSKVLAATTSAWKVLVPEDVELRAEVLHQMTLRHALPRNKSESIRKAFGVGTPEFDQAYSATVGESVDSVWGEDAGVMASLRRRFGKR